jgi:signal peptidase
MTALLVPALGAATRLPRGTAPGTSARHAAGIARSVLARLGPWVVRGIVAVAIVTFAGLAIGPHVFGYRTMTMLTGSMAPQINPGDVVVTTPIDVAEVTTGMAITYHIPVEDHHLITHRVVSVEHGPDGTVTVQTKGDANQAVDPWKATLSGDTAYRVRAVVPMLGHAIEWLRTPIVAVLLKYGATALVAGWLLMAIWAPAKPAAAAGRTLTARATPRPKKQPKPDRTKTGPTTSRRAAQRRKAELAAADRTTTGKEDQA